MTGDDLAGLPEELGITVTRLCSVLGIAATTYHDWKKLKEARIPNRTIAIAMRLLKQYPNLAGHDTDVAEIKDLLGLETRDLALTMGLEWQSGYRWEKDIKPSEIVQSLMSMVASLARDNPEAAQSFIEVVNDEAKVDGIPDVLSHKSWSQKKR